MNAAPRLHDDFKYELVHLGRERQPVLVIDNFLHGAEKLVDLAAQATFSPVADYVYPGVRARMPMPYTFAIRAALLALMCETFGFGDADIVGGQSDFSMATTTPEQAHVRQLLPHFDGPDLNVIAGVHFLCAPGFGGTSFYRHRKTGFEFIDEARREIYIRAIERDVTETPPAQVYVEGDHALFERTASFGAVFNRLLLYRGANLHAGDIGDAKTRAADPRTGRLTANTFLMFGPRR